MTCGGLEFLGRVSFVKHLTEVHKEGYKCEICGKHILRKGDFDLHMRMKHKEQRVWETT